MVLVGSDSGLGGAVHHCGLPSALAGSGKTPAVRAALLSQGWPWHLI